MPEAMSRWRKVTVTAAGWAGGLLRHASHGLPGILGPVLACWGVFEMWFPAGLVVAGGFLLAWDWRSSR